MDKENRAKQFMSFNPLSEYMELIRQRERIIVPKKDLCNESAEELDFKLRQVKVGMIVKVVYYFVDEYISVSGMVSKIDLDERYLTIVKEKIPIDDIIEISGDDIYERDEF